MMSWKDGNGRWVGSWHVGDGEYDFDQRVVVAQFDGHELEMLYSAMRNSYIEWGTGGRVGMNGES